jgi:hypothetical protein
MPDSHPIVARATFTLTLRAATLSSAPASVSGEPNPICCSPQREIALAAICYPPATLKTIRRQKM